MVLNCYKKEVFPNYLIYLEDTPHNRSLLLELLGLSNGQISGFTYIEVDLLNETWRGSFEHEWLYRNAPPLTDLSELIK